jgi:hypothetical protein
LTCPRFNDPIEPMILGNMRDNGIRSLAIYLNQCHHQINVDHWPAETDVPLFGPKMVCTKCWMIGPMSGQIGENAQGKGRPCSFAI